MATKTMDLIRQSRAAIQLANGGKDESVKKPKAVSGDKDAAAYLDAATDAHNKTALANASGDAKDHKAAAEAHGKAAKMFAEADMMDHHTSMQGSHGKAADCAATDQN